MTFWGLNEPQESESEMKTPTIAELRKLAKRKGHIMERWGFNNLKLVDSIGTVWLIVDGSAAVCRAAAFAALSALPDAPKGAKR